MANKNSVAIYIKFKLTPFKSFRHISYPLEKFFETLIDDGFDNSAIYIGKPNAHERSHNQ